jgi:hypothetical protein
LQCDAGEQKRHVCGANVQQARTNASINGVGNHLQAAIENADGINDGHGD